MTKHLDKPPPKPSPKTLSRRPVRGSPQGEGRSCAAAKAGWSPERRARQAELIRAIKPWKMSTGPRTAAGKARTAANALKHGFRSRSFIERIREERQLVRDATAIIVLAKSVIRALEARSMRGPHITVWTGDPDVDARPVRPNPPGT